LNSAKCRSIRKRPHVSERGELHDRGRGSGRDQTGRLRAAVAFRRIAPIADELGVDHKTGREGSASNWEKSPVAFSTCAHQPAPLKSEPDGRLHNVWAA
jgi:hypothetical protein